MPFKKENPKGRLVEFNQEQKDAIQKVLAYLKKGGKNDFQQASDQQVSWVHDTDSSDPYVGFIPADKKCVEIITDGKVTYLNATRHLKSGTVTDFSVRDYNYIIIKRTLKDAHSGRTMSYCSLIFKDYKTKIYIQKTLGYPLG